jgi:ATP-dependent RNA circularization protein (DNA/RNA ligase family)
VGNDRKHAEKHRKLLDLFICALHSFDIGESIIKDEKVRFQTDPVFRMRVEHLASCVMHLDINDHDETREKLYDIYRRQQQLSLASASTYRQEMSKMISKIDPDQH